MSEDTKSEAKMAPIGRVTWWGFGRRWYGTATGAIHNEGLGEYAVVDPDEREAWRTRLVLLSHVHPVGEGDALMAGELDAIEQAARRDLAVRAIDLVTRACAVFERRADEALRMAEEVRSLREREVTLAAERGALGRAIAEAAQRAGIYNGEVALRGPDLILLTQNMAEEIARLRERDDWGRVQCREPGTVPVAKDCAR